MKPELKQKWVEALRSGKYQQGRGKLKQETAGSLCFCVVGVLAEIMVAEGLLTCEGTVYMARGWDRCAYGLPLDALSAIGLSGYEESQLIKMNDEGMSFHRLASIIESDY